MTDQSGSNWGFVKACRDLVCGSVAGVAQAYSGQPLDTVKVRLQTNPELFKGPIDCFIQTAKQGPLRLYSGVVPMANACLLENAVLLAGYGQCQAFVRTVSGTNKDGQLSNLQLGCAGSLSGILAGFVLSPTEMVKCRLQVSGLSGHSHDTGMIKMTMDIFRMEGLKGVYRGLTYTWLRDIPSYGVNFYAYEKSRRMLCRDGEKVSELGMGRLILAGGMGGASSWLVSYPFDVLKSRVQIAGGDIPNPLRMFVDTWRKEGGMVYVRGITPCIIRGFIGYAALFVTYEWSGRLFDTHILGEE